MAKSCYLQHSLTNKQSRTCRQKSQCAAKGNHFFFLPSPWHKSGNCGVWSLPKMMDVEFNHSSFMVEKCVRNKVTSLCMCVIVWVGIQSVWWNVIHSIFHPSHPCDCHWYGANTMGKQHPLPPAVAPPGWLLLWMCCHQKAQRLGSRGWCNFSDSCLEASFCGQVHLRSPWFDTTGTVLLWGNSQWLHLHAEHTLIRVHALIETMFQIKCLHAQWLRQYSCSCLSAEGFSSRLHCLQCVLALLLCRFSFHMFISGGGEKKWQVEVGSHVLGQQPL